MSSAIRGTGGGAQAKEPVSVTLEKSWLQVSSILEEELEYKICNICDSCGLRTATCKVW